MKKSLLILILLFLVIPLFAEFNLGIIVDEFGDPTGENFLYTSSLGSYIDANMIESECYVRTTVDVWDLNGGLYLGFTFETHENEWSNPTRKAKVDSDATIKVKDEDGVVYSFSTSNSKYSTDTWNELTGKDALQFYELLINNKLLKVIIYYDALKYQFSIDCPNFESIFDEFARSIDTTLDIKKWHVENDYCYYKDIQYNSNEFYVLQLIMPRFEDVYDSMWIEVNSYIRDGMFVYPTDYSCYLNTAKIEFEEDTMIVLGQNIYFLSLEGEQFRKFLRLLKDSRYAIFSLEAFTDRSFKTPIDILSYTINSKDLLEIYDKLI